MNTSRIHRKNNPQTQAPQGKNPSIHGQNATAIGPDKFKTAGKVTLGAVRIGEAVGLTEKQIKAFALLADWEKDSPAIYCKGVLLEGMQTSFDVVEMATRHQFNDDAYERGMALLPIISKLLPRPLYKKRRPPSQKNANAEASLQRFGQLANASTPGRLETPVAFQISASQIGGVINLSDAQIKALALISEWEGLSPVEYCNSTVNGYLKASFDDMQVLAVDDARPREKVWARKFLHRTKQLLNSKGGAR